MRTSAIWFGFSTLLFTSAAFAAEKDWDGGYAIHAERRSGFAASVGLGLGVAAASGYPNEVSKIGDPRYESSTGVGLGSNATIWVGGALRDWFTFGLGFMNYGLQKGDLQVGAGGFIVHIEAFPLWALGGRLRDVSAFANFGAGTLTIEGGPEKADGGLVSVVDFGLAWEAFRVGYFAFGPTLDLAYNYSQSADGLGVFAGFRSVFYGGP